MPDRQTPPPLSGSSQLLRLAAIGGVVVVAAAAFAYVGGWLDPQRLTPAKLVNVLEQNNGVHEGFRRNHGKGICVAGYFESSPEARQYSSAAVFSDARTPVVGRFALPAGNPYAPDSAVPIRSMALRFALSNGQQWRTGMNSMPVFPVGTPQAFYDLQQASAPASDDGKPDPEKMKAFFGSHPETGPFLAWIKTAKPSASYATETYNSINAFYFVDGSGQRHPVRWGMVAQNAASPADAPMTDKNFLESELPQRIANGPLRWTLQVTLGEPGDATDDASKPWPAERHSFNAGTLVLESTQPQSSGECRDINYDPLVLPSGIQASADPLLAARSAAYATSYQRRTAEEAAGKIGKESHP